MEFLESFGANYLVLLFVALVISAVGFYKFVYFISLGYGFSVAGLGVALLAIYGKRIFERESGWILFGICLLFLIYGLRLGGYLLVREIKSAAYRSVMKNEIKDGSGMSLPMKICVWIPCALLYTFQVSPVYFRLKNGGGADVFLIVGTGIMACGIILEAASDWQKSRAKAKNPSRFCDEGLFKIVRCPNYLGEILCWSGVFISGVNVLEGAGQWIAAILGYVCIVYIMFGGARRLEIRQNKNYGKDKEYQEYVKKTPIILPFIPLYSVEKYKFLVG